MKAALIDPNIAFDIAVFLEGQLLINVDVPHDRQEKWREVIDALFAISNDVEAIVTSDEAVAGLSNLPISLSSRGNASVIELLDDDGLTSGGWRDCLTASLAQVQEIAAGQRDASLFVWPDEGEFRGETFKFNAEHNHVLPLICNRVSAMMLVKAYDVAMPDTQLKFTQWISKSRGHFAKVWEIVDRNLKVGDFLKPS